eukprot:CAMPEP_0117069468 /NCGR_PEP_ID=MMETSP0472-20121206/48733_1 /TAXON_ID=693140 ORGANISM="Tiarina fusus, Strain LIS" /NCGR_SAMPLE_ID=MMETSP0472 /ASSEMBLY_ACC=CAM_ASM_000603 /LENGTH=307 /DNA_ID=CAMNT_0004792037 /DNA_START=76 /DNA_END=999 /DNA_ORIENTATION=-
MISNTLANATFSDPKDHLLDFVPVTIESMPLDSFPVTAISYVDSWQYAPNDRKRHVAEIEPTPIGPRTSVNVVDQIPADEIISFDQCGDILVETFLFPMDRPTSCDSGFDMTKIEFEPSNKRRKFATITPRASFSSTEQFAWDEDEDCSISVECRQLAKPDQWYEKYQELCAFHARYGHCLVPNKTPEGNYQSLSQWVKRQRHQHKLKRLGRHSTLTEDREDALRKLDFVWDSHGATWNERFRELLTFKACNVPTDFPENPQLSIWVKCQRRQYKLHLTGKKSNINASRISKLNEINFVWNPRNLKV